MLLTLVTGKEDRRGNVRRLWSRVISSRRSRRERISDNVIDFQLYFAPHISMLYLYKVQTYNSHFRLISPWRLYSSNSGATTRRGSGWWTRWCRRGSARRRLTGTPSTASTGSAPCWRGGIVSSDFLIIFVIISENLILN